MSGITASDQGYSYLTRRLQLWDSLPKLLFAYGDHVRILHHARETAASLDIPARLSLYCVIWKTDTFFAVLTRK